MTRLRAAISLILFSACSRPSLPAEFPSIAELAADSSQTGELLKHLRALRDSAPAAFDSLSSILIMSVQMHLGRVGFGVGPFTGVYDQSTATAVKQFEAARGIPSTGNPFNRTTISRILDEIEEMERAGRALGPRSPVFGASQWAEGFVTVEGQWLMEPTPSATEDAVKIQCSRQEETCQILYAKIQPDDNVLLADEETYQIASWDNAEIISRPLDYPCARYLLRINRVQESATLVRSTLSRTRSCSHMTPADMVMHVASWSESSARNREQRHAVTRRLYNFQGIARDLIGAAADSTL